MTFDGLLVPGLLAFCIGAVAARRLPILGLVVVLVLIAGFGAARYGLGLATPDLLHVVVLVALVQAGYLVSAMIAPLGDRKGRDEAQPPLRGKRQGKDGPPQDGQAS